MVVATSEYPFANRAIQERQEEIELSQPTPNRNLTTIAPQQQITVPIPVQQAVPTIAIPKEPEGFWDEMAARGNELMTIMSPNHSLKSVESDHLRDIGGLRG